VAGGDGAQLSRGGMAIELSDLHKPWKFEEQRRIEAAGHYVVNGRLDGSLAVSRAIGDTRFKMPLPKPTPRPLAAFTTSAALATSTSSSSSSTTSSPSLHTTSTVASTSSSAPLSPSAGGHAIAAAPSSSLHGLGPPLLGNSHHSASASHGHVQSSNDHNNNGGKLDPAHTALTSLPHTRELVIDEALGDEFILIACDGIHSSSSIQSLPVPKCSLPLCGIQVCLM
jgi:serine/threonine protein phosphatase PrpC